MNEGNSSVVRALFPGQAYCCPPRADSTLEREGEEKPFSSPFAIPVGVVSTWLIDTWSEWHYNKNHVTHISPGSVLWEGFLYSRSSVFAKDVTRHFTIYQQGEGGVAIVTSVRASTIN